MDLFRKFHIPTFHSLSLPSFSFIHSETMRRRRSAFLFTFSFLLCFALFSLHLSRNALSATDFRLYPSYFPAITNFASHDPNIHYAIKQENEEFSHRTRRVSSIKDSVISTVSLLLPDWELLLIVSPDTALPSTSDDSYVCLFHTNATSPAIFSGTLHSPIRTTFKCLMPRCVRRDLPFMQPILAKSSDRESLNPIPSPPAIMIRWTFMAYDSISTEDDVVLFVKGVNHRQGQSRSPSEFRCVFGDADRSDAVRTAVTSSTQEVFRCLHPNLTGSPPPGEEEDRIKVSLEIVDENNLVVPSVAYYKQPRSVASQGPKSLLCACTMVHNVAKFLKEWVMYHSSIGVQKFFLYDNDSDDDLEAVVKELNRDGYSVETVTWIWPKTQEAGFSHSTIYAKKSCTWMLYVDVDEFVFSPSWLNSLQPSDNMLKSLLPETATASESRTGQITIKCNDFGPSNQRSHPIMGVTQGYTCRRRRDERHKSIILLDAVDPSLLNVIHHFRMKKGVKSKQVSMEEAVVNHYKFQAWPEFRTKFRRRVSAYVVDWTKEMNPTSKDRAPGLGFQAVEPQGWANKFCEVRDERLMLLNKRWFGSESVVGYKMGWQR